MRNFLKGGKLYRYDYGVDLDFFIAKSREGTVTLAYSDPPRLVLHRAYFLLKNGFGAYNLFNNNCEDFAIYCKTGLLAPRIIDRSGQIPSVFAAICAIISFPYSLLLTSISNFVGGRSIWKLFSDIGYRKDARRVGVQELGAFGRFSFMSH
nr:protein LEAD-SENSITIVE 1-like [Ziziphus jujuba var. spinosa]